MGSTLSNAWRQKASLRGAYLRHRDWSGEEFSHDAEFGVDLRDADFSGASLRGLAFDTHCLERADFRWADLTDCSLRNIKECNFAGSSLVKAELQHAIGDRADFRGANLRGADLTHAKLRFANFAGANLYQANLESADLRGACFADANLDASLFRGANLTHADFRGARLTTMPGGESYRQFMGANLEDARFEGAELNWDSPELLLEILRSEHPAHMVGFFMEEQKLPFREAILMACARKDSSEWPIFARWLPYYSPWHNYQGRGILPWIFECLRQRLGDGTSTEDVQAWLASQASKWGEQTRSW